MNLTSQESNTPSIIEPTYCFFNNETGFIEHIDKQTGRVIKIQVDFNADEFEGIKAGDGSIILHQKGFPPEDGFSTKRWIYSKTLESLICQRICEGKTLSQISQLNGVPPYYIIAKWKQEIPDFAQAIKQAEKDRAEVFQTKALNVSEDSEPETVSCDRLLVDTLKWCAQVDNPEKFANKTKISGDSEAPVTFIIETGINRGPEKPVEEIPK